MSTYTATYSPDDNKLRLYASSRLDAETYARVKAHGFKWAPKQSLFVAPMWTPSREDFLIELAGEIDDEDTSLTERQEERAERFEDYQDKRARDAESARRAVSQIADNIPLGQPILIGHHSEKHARRDAKRIEDGMRKSIRLWDTSQYWKSRAAGALAHAKYKELPAVRARRIKGIESDQRKTQKTYDRAERLIELWGKVDETTTVEQARHFANVDGGYWHYAHVYPFNHTGPISLWEALDPERAERNGLCITPMQARDKAIENHRATMASCARWLTHYAHRLDYERAMLAESGGLLSDRVTFEVGGRILRRGEWFVITKVNPSSVTVKGHWASTVTFDEIKEYQAPTPEEKEFVKAATKLPPMCNYPGENFVHMTRAEWEKRQWSDAPKSRIVKATDTAGAHRVRLTPSKVKQWTCDPVYLTDEKRKDPPAAPLVPPPTIPPPERAAPTPRPAYVAPEPTIFDAMKDTLAAGVQIVTAPQLFPTPPELAARMVELAEIGMYDRVLEPSAGTGNLLKLMGNGPDKVAVEINADLIRGLLHLGLSGLAVHHKDFLTCNGDLGTFDRIVMNPPFSNAEDIRHIQHARTMLKPGGRLVALCANGPRQQDQLKPLASHWEDLPLGSFHAAGTGVRVAMLVIEG